MFFLMWQKWAYFTHFNVLDNITYLLKPFCITQNTVSVFTFLLHHTSYTQLIQHKRILAVFVCVRVKTENTPRHSWTVATARDPPSLLRTRVSASQHGPAWTHTATAWRFLQNRVCGPKPNTTLCRRTR